MYMHWTNHTVNSTYTPGFDIYRLQSVNNKILGLYMDPVLGPHKYDDSKKRWEIPLADSHIETIYHDLKDYYAKNGWVKSFTNNSDVFGQPAEYMDAYSLAGNYTEKNTIYKDSHGDSLIPVTGMNPLSFPVLKNYTQNAHEFFFTRVITNFNMIPKMLDVQPIKNTQIGLEGKKDWKNQRFYR